MSVAVKRSANYPAVNDVKRPALDSVNRHSVQVHLSACIAFISSSLLFQCFSDAIHCR